MKKLYIFVFLFIVYALIINLYPVVTQWDINVISVIQNKMQNYPLWIPMLLDSKLYSLAIIFVIAAGFVYFIRKYLIIDIVLLASSPLAAYLCNIIIKNTVQRQRPPLDMQLVVQPSTFSFVSSHTLVITTLFGITIYYLNKYCINNCLKAAGIIFSVLLIIFTGFSRIWLGVHNPTDVIGGYFLGLILVYIYIKLIKLIGGKC